MAKLTYTMMASLDGFVSDLDGGFNWGQINEAVHAHANDEARRLMLSVYGRRMYETMIYWETYDGDVAVAADFARIWCGQEKIVVSRTLARVESGNTRLLRDLDAAKMQVLKARAAGEIGVSGPELAAGFLDAGLVDEIGIYVIPVVAGSGGPMFRNRKFLTLERLECVPFDNGVTFTRYRVKPQRHGLLA